MFEHLALSVVDGCVIGLGAMQSTGVDFNASVIRRAQRFDLGSRSFVWEPWDHTGAQYLLQQSGPGILLRFEESEGLPQ